MLVGPSGCGKSALCCALLAGLESLSAGTILMNNRPINDPIRGPRCRHGFQSYALYPPI